jgi:hypothetical protein
VRVKGLPRAKLRTNNAEPGGDDAEVPHSVSCGSWWQRELWSQHHGSRARRGNGAVVDLAMASQFDFGRATKSGFPSVMVEAPPDLEALLKSETPRWDRKRPFPLSIRPSPLPPLDQRPLLVPTDQQPTPICPARPHLMRHSRPNKPITAAYSSGSIIFDV